MRNMAQEESLVRLEHRTQRRIHNTEYKVDHNTEHNVDHNTEHNVGLVEAGGGSFIPCGRDGILGGDAFLGKAGVVAGLSMTQWLFLLVLLLFVIIIIIIIFFCFCLFVCFFYFKF